MGIEEISENLEFKTTKIRWITHIIITASIVVSVGILIWGFWGMVSNLVGVPIPTPDEIIFSILAVVTGQPVIDYISRLWLVWIFVLACIAIYVIIILRE